MFLPVSFRFDRKQALEAGIIASMQTIVINHKLDDKYKRIWARARKKTKKEIIPKYSEKEWYFKKELALTYRFTPAKAKQVIGQQMARFLYNLPSKATVAKQLLSKIEGKSILFSERLALLNLITPYVITNKNSSSFVIGDLFYDKKKRKDKVVYIKRHLLELKEKNITEIEYLDMRSKWLTLRYDSKRLFEMFNDGEIFEIGSSKAIGRGTTLKNVDNGILLSYGSKHTGVSQKVARTWRLDNKENKVANLYVIKTLDSFEENWFVKMQNIYDKNKKIADTMDLNIVKEIPSFMLGVPNFKL